MSIKLQTKQIAKLFQVTTATIGNYVKLGMPKEGRGCFDLFSAHKWWVENVLGIEKDASGMAETSELSEAKLRWYSARASQAEHKLAVEKGKYFSKKAIEKQWAHRVGLVTSGLEALVFRLPGPLAGKNRQEMARIIKSEVRALRFAYSMEGKYTPSKRVLSVLEPCLRRLDDLYNDGNGGQDQGKLKN